MRWLFDSNRARVVLSWRIFRGRRWSVWPIREHVHEPIYGRGEIAQRNIERMRRLVESVLVLLLDLVFVFIQ
jgi:hypothetical protein